LGGGVATPDRVLAGGNMTSAGFDTSLLLNTDFAQFVPLYPVDRGSRPKGWRASPLAPDDEAAFGVWLAAGGDAGKTRDRRHAALGLRKGTGAKPVEVANGQRAILAQEIRNPRAGHFTFSVEACIAAATREAGELFQKHFTCRLAIYRFAEADKNPLKRHEFGSLVIQPPLVVGNAPRWVRFEFTQILDGASPGQNFSIGRGLGVAIEVEKTLEGPLAINGLSAALQVGSARLSFASHTIDDKVVV
jgi:hypothetical protein